MAKNKHHGEYAFGDYIVPHSVFYKGKFGRLFRKLPALSGWGESQIKRLARWMFDQRRKEKDSLVPAGYTYLGQFINHDITFDPTSELGKQNDPERINNFRTPRFDLDSVYGRGPMDAQFMYQSDQMRFLLETVSDSIEEDIPRRIEDIDIDSQDPRSKDLSLGYRHIAVIGDPRNDENIIVSQLHLAFMKFHNEIVDILVDRSGKVEKKLTRAERRKIFVEAQRETRFHFQWLVVHDFLHRIVGKALVKEILNFECYTVVQSVDIIQDSHLNKNYRRIFTEKVEYLKPRFVFYEWQENPYLPVEFSAAAFRFGHSMVRPFYALNSRASLAKVPIFDNNANKLKQAKAYLTEVNWLTKISDYSRIKELDETDESRLLDRARTLISDRADDLKDKFNDIEEQLEPNGRSLAGFQERPKEWTIEWERFFEFKQYETKLQFAQKINTKLAKPLQKLSFLSKDHPDNSLAFLNLRRGQALGLPSGQSIANAMGLPEHLILPNIEHNQEREIDLFPDSVVRKLPNGAGLPLWFYILKEAEVFMNGECLGPVGGRIVAEVLIGLLIGDPNSYVNENPHWKPQESIFKDAIGKEYSMADFLRLSGYKPS